MTVDALNSLHADHAPAVRAYALRRSDPQTADDVCAEVWATAWRRIAEIPVDALPWLFGVARRCLANHRRGQRRLAALRDRLTTETTRAAMAAPAPELRGDQPLALALASLKPSDREVLLLIAWEDLTPERAAASLGIKPGTFAVRLHRARARLADALEAEGAHRPLRPSTPARETTR